MSVESLRAEPALAGWLAALARLFVIPAGYRDENVDRVGALDMLRCGPAVLDALIRDGLPCSGEPGAERFDRYDLFNLALYSGSNSSVPERAIQFALRWMGKAPETWLNPMAWQVGIELACPEQHGCGDAPTWSMARPTPEAFGGRTIELRTDPAGATIGREDVTAQGSPAFGLTVDLETRGERRQLRAPALREIVDEFMTGDWRWARMPEELQARPDLVLPHGVAPCISVSLRLAERCAAAGFQARTRRGWILGMLDLAHAWLEVVDEDGQLKVVDPIFAMLSDHAVDPHPDFRAVCLGSRVNRLLPSEHSADNPLAQHTCGGVSRVPKKKVVVRSGRQRLAAQAAASTEHAKEAHR
ncbi:hypothetical protein [Solihabitans fulvus]|uniref:hypothetical protein n=1 Tax=Solihabitans fulvus TaxID=1892852 RepID=UPI001CB7672E|nr:hypothetical protein [Solihabitans fulvus]